MAEGPQSYEDGTFGFVDPQGASWVFVGRIFISGVLLRDFGTPYPVDQEDSSGGFGLRAGDQVWVFRRAESVASLN